MVPDGSSMRLIRKALQYTGRSPDQSGETYNFLAGQAKQKHYPVRTWAPLPSGFCLSGQIRQKGGDTNENHKNNTVHTVTAVHCKSNHDAEQSTACSNRILSLNLQNGRGIRKLITSYYYITTRRVESQSLSNNNHAFKQTKNTNNSKKHNNGKTKSNRPKRRKKHLPNGYNCNRKIY